MADCLQQDEGGPWDPLCRRQQRHMDEVVRLWEGAAEQGHVHAQHNLGIVYRNGRGVDVNYKKMVEWYEKAAEQGVAEAQYNLGVMYEYGDGVDQSDSMAMRWYAKAAAQGNEKAQTRIGRIIAKRRSTAGRGRGCHRE